MYKMEYDKEWVNKVYIESVKEDGKKEGLKIGKKEGITQAIRNVAFRLKERGESIQGISNITELSVQELHELFKSDQS